MNIALWVVQVLLALLFGMAGLFKSTQPKEKLEPQMKWVQDFSPTTVKLIGGLEVLGALGLVLPMITGVLPWLTPLAALCLAITMIGAVITHARRGENQVIPVNLVLLLLAAFVAYGRFLVVPA